MMMDILFEIYKTLKERNANEKQLQFFKKAIKNITIDAKKSHRRNMRVLGLIEEEIKYQLDGLGRKESAFVHKLNAVK